MHAPSPLARVSRAAALGALVAIPLLVSAGVAKPATALPPLATALASSAIAPAPGHWSGDFSIPSFDGPTTACAVFEGAYIVAGNFHWAGGVPTSNVAVWTGSAWRQAGDGLPGPVNCLEVSGARLLAGTTTNGDDSPVMEFDGQGWRPVGRGVYGTEYALLASGSTLYAAGENLLMSDVANFPGVIAWDGESWKRVGGGFDGRVRALAIYHGELYAAGEFLSVEGVFASRIARFDGTHWQDVGGGTGPGGFVYIHALAVMGDRLYAGGSFTSIGGVDAHGLAAWDGVAWSALPGTPTDVIVEDLEVEGTRLHAAGLFQVPNQYASGLVTFDGTTWAPPASYPDWRLSDVATGSGALIGVGDITRLVNGPGFAFVPARNAVVRDPGWRTLEAWQPGMRGLVGPAWTQVSALLDHDDVMFAGGYFERAAGPDGWTYTNGIAQWDGDAWRPVPGGLRGWVETLAEWRGQLVAGSSGLYTGDASSSVMGWDGTRWNNLGGSLSGYISRLTVWNDALVAVGEFPPVQGLPAYALAITRGAGWQKFGAEVKSGNSWINCAAAFRGELVIGGFGLVLAGASLQPLLRWDGSTWRTFPDPPSQNVLDLLPRADGLWVAFSYPFLQSGLDFSAVWRWDGSSWAPVGSLDGRASRIAELGDGVYAAGSFFVDGQSTGLARWDGESWRAVPDGPEGRVTAMAAHGNELFVGGGFSHTGNRQAEAIARWVDASPRAALHVAMGPPWPTPSRDRAMFRFTLPAGGRVRLEVYDVRGALVAEPLDESLPAGTHERTWSFASSPHRVRAGIYFAKLVTDHGTSTTRLVIAP